MRARLSDPAIVTYRSRGSDSTATRLAAGSTRMIMIVSLRSPTRPLSSSPNAGANGESGSTHAPLSAPVRRKFDAVGSAGGNVSPVVVGGAGGAVSPGATLAVGRHGRARRSSSSAAASVGRVDDLDDVAAAHDHVAGDERAGSEEAQDRGDDRAGDGQPFPPGAAVPGRAGSRCGHDGVESTDAAGS